MLTPNIIFEDEDLMVIDKPSGWITNEAETTKGQPTIQGWVKENFNFPIFSIREYRNGIVHRLDKETSGILLIAKTKEAFEELQRQFKEREIEKAYTALVHGKMNSRSGVINVPVGRLPWRRDRFGVLPGGRESETLYEVVSEHKIKEADFSLVKFKPKTGRTHQIRIHAKYLGNPIVADEFYAGRKTARGDRSWCPRLFLHASSITFKHPVTKEIMKFESELPQDLLGVLTLK